MPKMPHACEDHGQAVFGQQLQWILGHGLSLQLMIAFLIPALAISSTLFANGKKASEAAQRRQDGLWLGQWRLYDRVPHG